MNTMLYFGDSLHLTLNPHLKIVLMYVSGFKSSLSNVLVPGIVNMSTFSMINYYLNIQLQD